jgi:hypothetical protein
MRNMYSNSCCASWITGTASSAGKVRIKTRERSLWQTNQSKLKKPLVTDSGPRVSEPRAAAPPDFDALYAQLLSQMAGPLAVESPQLGRVQFAGAADLYQSLNIIRMEQARAAGQSTAGVFTVGCDRGLSMKGGC